MKNPDWTRDEIILACDLVRRNGWKPLGKKHPEVIQLSKLLNDAPIHTFDTRGSTFRNPDGVSRKTLNIASLHPEWRGKKTNTSHLDREVLNDFLADGERMAATAKAIRKGLSKNEFPAGTAVPDVDESEEDDAHEGLLLERRHFVRERDRKLRAEKIAEHLSVHETLDCQICGFDFFATYGDRGAGYIECHHIIPLHASGPKKTKLKDLILICANCHRMIHYRQPWLMPDDLRRILRENHP